MTRLFPTCSALVAAVVIGGPARAQEPTEELYLELYLNGFAQQLILDFELRGDRLYTTLDELAAAGVSVGDLAAGADGLIALDSIPEARYRYSQLEQRIDLELPPSRLAPNLLGYNTPPTTAPRSDKGLVLNYAINVQSEPLDLEQSAYRRLAPLPGLGVGKTPKHAQADFQSAYDQRNRTTTLDTDLRFFAPFGLFVERGYFTEESGDSDYTRYDTFWNYTSVEPMRSYTIGDFVSASLTWTRSLRLGGARVSRNFDVRPDLVTFPLPLMGANAVVPTTVDLYVNGRRQFSGSTDAGPFVIVDPPVLTGAGDISLVYRDNLGREIVATQPLYVDSRLLDRGLSDYAFEIGYPRRSYGTLSSDYGDDEAAAASLRYGVNELLTLEGHAEGGADLENVGVGALVALGHFGVLNASYSASSDAGARGKQTSLGYQYIARHWSLDVYERETQDDFRDLGSLEDSPVATRFSRAGVSITFGNHTGSINYTRQEDPSLGGTRIVSAGYNASQPRGRTSVYVTAFRDLELEDSDGFYVGVSVNFGERSSLYSGASKNGDDETTVLGSSRPVDYDLGGIGWNVYAESGNDDYGRATARIDYRNRFGDWSAQLEQTRDADLEDETNASLYGAGAVVYMKRALFATRAIYDGFALVSTVGTPDVPVLRENRLLGSTNRRGFYLVPDLPAFRTSRLAIDPLDLPVDVNVGAIQIEANPFSLSGVLVEFPLERYRGATLMLVDEEGVALGAGLRATLLSTGESALIGYEGRVFFGALEPRNRIVVETDEGTCEIEVTFAPEQTMQTIGPFTCRVGAP